MEEDRKNSAGHYQTLMKVANDGIHVLDMDGNLIEYNEAFRHMLGYEDDLPLNIRDWDVSIPPEELPDKLRKLAINPGLFETRYKRRDGSVIDVEINAAGISLNEKQYVYASSRDISHRKEVEAELQNSKQFLSNVFEFLPDATFVIDIEGKVIAWNKAMEEMTGVDEADMLGKGNYEYALTFYQERRPILIDLVLHPRSDIELKYTRTDRHNLFLEAETHLPSLKGKEVYLFGKASTLRDSKGNVVGAIESIRDITVEKKAEASLRESQQKLADIIDFLPDATFVVDQDNRVITWNKAMEHMSGVDKTEIIGQGNHAYSIPFWGDRRETLLDHLELDEGKLASQYDNIVRQGKSLMAETFCPLLRSGQGSYIWAIVAPLYNIEGKHVGAIETIRDITERKKMEADLQRSNQELEQFAYVASHDLRSPLRAIENLSEWLVQDLGDDLPEESEKHLKLMRTRVKRMDRMLEDLLKYSRVGRIQAVIEEIDATAVVFEIIDDQDLNSRFKITTDSLPAFTTYATPFKQILQNLIGNAAKHHDTGKGNIVVRAKKLDRFYEFSIADDGPGIPEQYREKVFGMFQTLRPRDEVEGSGIGLALVKKTVEHYGGNVKLDAVTPRGTLVTFTWPVNILEVEE